MKSYNITKVVNKNTKMSKWICIEEQIWKQGSAGVKYRINEKFELFTIQNFEF